MFPLKTSIFLERFPLERERIPALSALRPQGGTIPRSRPARRARGRSRSVSFHYYTCRCAKVFFVLLHSKLTEVLKQKHALQTASSSTFCSCQQRRRAERLSVHGLSSQVADLPSSFSRDRYLSTQLSRKTFLRGPLSFFLSF